MPRIDDGLHCGTYTYVEHTNLTPPRNTTFTSNNHASNTISSSSSSSSNGKTKQ